MVTEEIIKNFHCLRWEELPSLSLYMDQVVIVLEETLRPLFRVEEPVLTATMINNYVKHKLIAPPEKKKYTKDHIASLIVISVLKRILSIMEIKLVIDALTAQKGKEKAYDGFCDELEQMLKSAFVKKEMLDVAVREGLDALQSAALAAFTAKLLVDNMLEGLYSPKEIKKSEEK